MKIKLQIRGFFNMDETSHTIVQRPEKIIAQKANITLVPSYRAIDERSLWSK